MGDLDSEYLEDYVEAHDTGMEADEEKEIQLQKIMQGQGGSIPLPVIVPNANPVRELYPRMRARRHIRWSRDCKNEYIDYADEVLEIERAEEGPGGGGKTPAASQGECTSAMDRTSALDGKLVSMSRISSRMKEAFTTYGGSPSATTNEDEKLINYVLSRVLVRYEKNGYEAYACFRKRVFHPTFKSRRNEAIMLEKLERMGAEFQCLRRLCGMLHEKCETQRRLLLQDSGLLAEYHSAGLSGRTKRAYRKRILGIPEDEPPNKLAFNVHSIMTNREKIACMKSMRPSSELLMDIRYYREVMALLEAPVRSPVPEHPPKKVCRLCRGEGGGVSYSDDRKHSV